MTKIITTITSLLIGCSLFASEALSILNSEPGLMIIEIKTDSLFIDENNNINITPFTNNQSNSGLPIIPQIQEVLINVPSTANIDVFFDSEKTIDAFTPSIQTNESAKGIDYTIHAESWNGEIFPQSIVNLSSSPDIRGNTASVLTVYPVQIQFERLYWWKEITIQITWSETFLTKTPTLFSKQSLHQLENNRPLSINRTSVSLPDYQYSENIAKITVNSNSWYAMTKDELADSGLTVQGIDPRTLRLWNKTDEIPIYVEGEDDGEFNSGDKIIFYGELPPPPEGVPYIHNFYTDKNVYWLTWGDAYGERMYVEGAYPGEELPSFQKPIMFKDYRHIEKNEHFSRLGQVSSMTHHQWDKFDHFFMNPPIYNGTTTDYELEFHFPASSNFQLELEFQGLTTDEHIIQVEFNGHLIGGTESWFGQSLHKFLIEISENDNIPINNGINTLTVINLDEDTGGRHDLIYLNWINIEYDHFLKTSTDSLNIYSNEQWLNKNIEFTCTGFTHPDIYIFKNKYSLLTDFLTIPDQQNDNYNIIFQDIVTQNNTEYQLLSTDKLKNVISIKEQERILSPLSNITNDYIAICPDSFQVILEPLVVGYNNGVLVNIDDVYRQYSYGVVSPYAIKEFLTDIYYSNNRTLNNVLIGMQGGWSGFQGGNIIDQHYIPAMRIQTLQWGAASSDYWYTCIEGNDIYGEFAIGRFPAKNKEELSIHVNKTLNYNIMSDQPWNNNILLIAGYEETFKIQSESFIKPIIHDAYFPSRLYIDATSETGPYYGETITLLNYFKTGQSYINFFGHGGGAVWGDRSILTLDALPYLENEDRLPFITSMTCFTGDVTNPNGLGRRMLALEDAGAIGWFGSSGVGWVINDYLLLQPILSRLVSGDSYTLGDILLQGKIEYAATNLFFPEHTVTQVYQFNYSGDPALRLKKPTRADYSISISDPEQDETIEISLDPVPNDSVYYQIYYPNYHPINFSPDYSGDNEVISYTINDTIPGTYRMNVTGIVNDNIYSTSIPYTLSGSSLIINEIIPNEPTIMDSINIIATAVDRQGISTLKLLLNGQDYSNLVNIGGDNYTLSHPISPQTPGTNLVLQLRAEDSQGNITTSPSTTISIPSPPDFYPLDIFFTVEDSIGLKAKIKNSIFASGSAKVIFEKYVNNNWTYLGYDSLFFNGFQQLDAIINADFADGTHLYRVITDSYDFSYNTYNDTLVKSLTTTAFYTSPGDTVHIPGIACYIESGEGIIQFDEITQIDLSNQPDFSLQSVDPTYEAIQITTPTNINYSLSWNIHQDTLSSNLFKYYQEVNIWLPIEYSHEDSIVTFNLSGNGVFAFLQTDDLTKPFTEATVNAQRFIDDTYINTTPTIYISASDDNGIDHRTSSIQCWTNTGDSLVSEHQSGNGNTLGLQFLPKLSVSDSIITFLIKDASGNSSDTLSLRFIVKEKLDLIDYGNFPNPFSNQTRFTYELTETVDKYYLDLYTVSGRKIRRFTSASVLTDLDPNLGGFHEIVWDGRDEDGNFVSNGVYFYKMTAKKGKTTIERIGKVVKAR